MATTSRRERSSSRQLVPTRTTRQMTREDICNVEPVSPSELLGMLSPLTAMDHADSEFADELDRWTLAEGGER